jgi:hypothetical protein
MRVFSASFGLGLWMLGVALGWAADVHADVRTGEPENFGAGVVAASPAEAAGSEAHLVPSRAFGPFLVLGAPHPLAFGLRLRHSVKLDFEAEGGLLSFGLGARRLSISHTQVSTRWFPRAGGFFLGAHVGYQSVAIVGPIPITEEEGAIRFSALYVSPGVGYEWKYTSGLTLGVGLAWQFPLVSSGAFYQGDVPDSRRSLARIAGLPLPSLTLLKLGWMFPLN